MTTNDNTLRIDMIINDPNFTRTGIVWQGTFGQLEIEAYSKRSGIPVEQLDVTFTGDGDPNQWVVIRRVFPAEETK